MWICFGCWRVSWTVFGCRMLFFIGVLSHSISGELPTCTVFSLGERLGYGDIKVCS